jgi:putative ABC transport system permease protein
MNVALRKIAGDLRQNWGRVALLFAAIAIGQGAMTATFSARAVLDREISRDFAAANPPQVTVETTGLGTDALAGLRGLPGVEALDTRVVVSARTRLAGGAWRPILLFGVRDFADLPVSRIFPTSGVWPPGAGEVLIERSGLGMMAFSPAAPLEVQAGPDHQGALRFAGSVHDPSLAPSWQEGMLYGYATQGALARIAGPERPLQLRATAAAGADPIAVGKALTREVQRLGGRVVRLDTSPPRHPHADLMQGLMSILSLFSLLSFVLALSLAGSVVAAFTQRQARQFAVLRALGASGFRIGLIHLAVVLVPALTGVALGAAAGSGFARLLEAAVAGQLNIDIRDAGVGSGLATGLVLAGLAAAAAAALGPVTTSLRRPVREALQGAAGGRARGGLVLPGLAPLDRLAVAEAFSRPLRTTVAVLALALGGGALIASTNVYDSLVGVIDRELAARHDTLELRLDRTPDRAILEAGLRRIPGLRDYELWGLKAVALEDGRFSTGRLGLFSPKAGTILGLPKVTAGRWPSGPGEIAVSGVAARRTPGFALVPGRRVVLSAGAQRRLVTVVGVVDEFDATVWTGPATFAEVATPRDLGRDLRVAADPARADAVAAQVEQAVIAAGSFPDATLTRAARREMMVGHFFAFYCLLATAALAAAAVGGLALSTTIASNVLERTREIGVLRAVGAGTGALARFVLVQALAIAGLSQVLAVALALPVSRLAVDQLETNALHLDLPLRVSVVALAGSAFGAAAIAAIAALAPAWRLARLSVREAVAHE